MTIHLQTKTQRKVSQIITIYNVVYTTNDTHLYRLDDWSTLSNTPTLLSPQHMTQLTEASNECSLHWTVNWCLEVCSCSYVIRVTLYSQPFQWTATALSSTAFTQTMNTAETLPSIIL